MPGFVHVHNEKTLLIPDRAGNNRIDSFRNILHDPRVALLFLIPGCGETLRVKGRAVISADPILKESFAANGQPPGTVLVVFVERVFYQCARAIARSKLWDPTRHVDRRRLPSGNAILAAIKWQGLRRVFGAQEAQSSQTAASIADHNQDRPSGVTPGGTELAD